MNFWNDVASHLCVSSASVVEVEAILISTVQDPEKDAVHELKDEEQGRIHDVDVSKNKGTPKWMVYNDFIMENLIKMDDLGVPLFLETSR